MMSELSKDDLNKHFKAAGLKDAIPFYHAVCELIRRALANDPTLHAVRKTEQLWTFDYKYSALYKAEISLFLNGAKIRYSTTRRIEGSHFNEQAIRQQHKLNKLFPINGMNIKSITYGDGAGGFEFSVFLEVPNE